MMTTIETEMNYALRQKRLAAELRELKLEGLLVTHLANVRYLCGFGGSAGVLLLLVSGRGHKAVFFTDGRYTQQAQQEVRSAKVVIGKRAAFVEACEGAQKARAGVLGFEAEHLSYGAYKQLTEVLNGKSSRSYGQPKAGGQSGASGQPGARNRHSGSIEKQQPGSKARLKPVSGWVKTRLTPGFGVKTRLTPVYGLVEELRVVKDADEISQIRASVLLAASLFQTALSVIKPGVAESQIAGELELQARRAGAEKMSFDTIVAAGARSALPHGLASTQPIPTEGFIILDYGVILGGYCSDMTRTVHAGAVSKAHRRMYHAVREAQLASVGAVRPGVEAGEVDRAGREVLKEAGLDVFFTHSTGHGVGIEVHEPPRVAKGQTQKLVPGMVITIEPGIYIPEEGGVRIEDMVLVTETGHEVLTPTTKDLITL